MLSHNLTAAVNYRRVNGATHMFGQEPKKGGIVSKKNATPPEGGLTRTKLVYFMMFALALELYLWAQIFSLAKEGPEALPLIVFLGTLSPIVFAVFVDALLGAMTKGARRSRAT